MTITRRAFGMLGAAAPFAIGRARAQTAEFQLKYGTAFPVDHPGAVRLQEAAEAIRKESNGRIDIQVYANSQLGSEPDMFSQTRSGALEFMSTSGVNLTLVPVGGINAIPFAFKDYDQVWAAMDGGLGAHVRAAFAKSNLFLFEKALDNGYRNITTSTKAIATPDDLKGVKIRVPANQLWVSTFKALGAAPTPVNFGELYSALQTKIVDAQENPLSLIKSAKLYEAQKYLSMTGHIWDGHYILTNAKNWAALPDDVKSVITKHFSEAALKERTDIREQNEKLEGEMQAMGLAVNTPDKQPFRDALKAAGFYEEWRKRYGDEAWAVLEKYSGSFG
jgi:tripartite ATP-independent transporter DctP family solute receptor